MGIVTEPAQAEDEAVPRTVSMSWGDICDTEVSGRTRVCVCVCKADLYTGRNHDKIGVWKISANIFTTTDGLSTTDGLLHRSCGYPARQWLRLRGPVGVTEDTADISRM